MNQIKLEDVTVSYHGQVALYEASLDINKGDFIGIIGENGSGKTTMLKSILGLVSINDGAIYIDQKLKIGYVPQYISRKDFTFPATAKEVVLMGLLSEKTGWKKFTKMDQEKVRDIFHMLHIEHLMNKRVGELSGGQQQRVLLARALVNNPEILLLDEPTSALDKVIEDSFLKLLEKLNREKEITIVVVTHDLASLGEYVNQIVYVNKKIIFNGEFRDFCQNNKLSPYIHTHDIKGCDQS